MSRKPCCTGEGLKKGAWTAEEDKKLIAYIHDHGEGGWRDIPAKAGLKRCGKSCRLRWTNYLKPEIKRGEFSYEEEQIIIMLHASRGNKWSVIARHLPRRTDNEIKNYWNTHLKKRLIDQGIDPVTHKPFDSSNPATPHESSDSQNALSNESRDYSRSSSMSSLSRPPSSEIINKDETSIKKGSSSCKKPFGKSNSTCRLLNKVASKATSMKEILSASMAGSLSSSTLSNVSFNGDISKNNISNIEEDDNSNVSTTNFDEYYPLFQSTSYPEYEINADSDNFGMNGEFDDLSNILEKLGHEDNNTNVGYGRDFLMSDVSSTSVDDQENMIDNTNGWSNYLLDNTDFIYEADSNSLGKHFI